MPLDSTLGVVRTTAAGDRTMSIELGPAYVSIDLRDYLRILNRRRAVIYWVFGIVVGVSLVLTAYQTYTTYDIVQAAVIVNQDAPQMVVVKGVPQISTLNPVAAAHDNSVAVVQAFHALANRRSFFDALATDMNARFQLNWTWQQPQSLLDNYLGSPATGDDNVEYFQASASPLDYSKIEYLVTMAVAKYKSYLPEYLSNHANQPPVTIRDYQALNSQKVHLSKVATGFVSRILAGVVLALILAFVWEYLDDFVRDSHDVERLLHTQALAIVPMGERRGQRMHAS